MNAFAAGQAIVAREVWDGLLWAARPARVVSDDGDELIHWTPAGVTGCFATSRYFPGREGLPPNERQLVSLESRQWHYRGVPARGTSLAFLRKGVWASIAPTWYPDGTFAHWYVNFQLPMRRHETGYDTLDLVVDIVVAPDWSWAWKDREAFDAAVERGIFGADIAESVEGEALGIQDQIREKSGPFDPAWARWLPRAD